jgi:hypothetical protein
MCYNKTGSDQIVDLVIRVWMIWVIRKPTEKYAKKQLKIKGVLQENEIINENLKTIEEIAPAHSRQGCVPCFCRDPPEICIA